MEKDGTQSPTYTEPYTRILHMADLHQPQMTLRVIHTKIVEAILMYISVLIYFCCMHVYIGEVLYCPYDKRPALRHYRRRFYSVPFVRHKDTYSVLLTHDNLCKPTPVFCGGATIL